MSRSKRKKSQDPVPNANWVRQQEMLHMQQFASSRSLQMQTLLRDEWLDMAIKATLAAEELIRRNIAIDLFRVFTILTSRWLSHHQAISALLISGRYGEATALSRMLLEVTEYLTYFALIPEEAKDWREAFSRAPFQSAAFTVGRSRFSLPMIRRVLAQEEMSLLSKNEYAHLSAAVHASEWGAQFYGRRIWGNPPRIALQFAPGFDMRVAFHIGSLAYLTAPRPTWAFLEMCRLAKAPKSVWRALHSEYMRQIAAWEAFGQADRRTKAIMEETERRIADGEEFEDIRRDIDQRYGLGDANTAQGGVEE